MDLPGLRSRLDLHGQVHLLRHWDLLDEEGQGRLYRDLDSIDYERVGRDFKEATQGVQDESGAGSISDRMELVDPSLCASYLDTPQEKTDLYRRATLRAISRGEVGVLLLAGGQGTRLGVPYPKGMFDIGLPSHKTLYQIQMERVLRLQRMAAAEFGDSDKNRVTVYVMTSEHTKAPTREFLERNGHFGLRPEDVVLFEQRMIPCLTTDGKIILESAGKVARAPDGNGGLYWALREEGALSHMEGRGVRYLHAYCVDNVLVKVADPVFVGYAIEAGAESANKVVEKAFPAEAVGVVCRVDGKVQVVEYSEISDEKSSLRDPDGRLSFRAGNICNHFFTTPFLRRVCGSRSDPDSKDRFRLPWHVAKKKIPYADPDTGETVKPEQVNGIKLERFVFDVFQFSDSFLVWECAREDEFSPLKNAEGPGKKDTPATAREALFDLHRRYVKRAGGLIDTPSAAEANGGGGPEASRTGGENGVNGHSSDSAIVCEISPLLSYAGENLEEAVGGKGGKVLTPPVLLS